jgi:hypothetical protein
MNQGVTRSQSSVRAPAYGNPTVCVGGHETGTVSNQPGAIMLDRSVSGGGEGMLRINGSLVYWVGMAVGSLQIRLVPGVILTDVLQPALTVRQSLEAFLADESVPLKMTKGVARMLLNLVGSLTDASRVQTNPAGALPQAEIDNMLT